MSAPADDELNDGLSDDDVFNNFADRLKGHAAIMRSLAITMEHQRRINTRLLTLEERVLQLLEHVVRPPRNGNPTS